MIIFVLLIVGLFFVSINLFYKYYFGGKLECFSNYKKNECYFFKDKYYVYYKSFVGQGKGRSDFPEKFRIKNADLDTFKVLNKKFAKDKNNAYVCFSRFKSFNNPEAKCVRIEYVDVSTFKIADSLSTISDNYTKDKDRVYFLDQDSYQVKTIENVDLDTFKVKFDIYSMDKNNCYKKNEITYQSDCGMFEK